MGINNNNELTYEGTEWSSVMICINCKKYDKDKRTCTYRDQKQKLTPDSYCSLWEERGGLIIQPRKLTTITNYLNNAREYYKAVPFFYDKTRIFWLWNKELNCYQEIDETDLIRLFNETFQLEGLPINNKIKNSYLEAFKWVGREQSPQEAPKRWIQFKNKAFSIRSKKIHNITPDYYFTNPIPWDIGINSNTPTIDKLFTEWVGNDYKQTLYEIIAYCTYRDYPIQVLFCLYGPGRNGKTCFLRLLTKFLGATNVCSTDLDLIAGNNKSRFECYKLYKKLVCLMGETNFGILSSSSLIKKLTGNDRIGYEKKGKDPFDDFNYAKIIIASNSLPISTDTSEGFYRRWDIVPFTNEFPEGHDVLETIPDCEYEALAFKVLTIIPRLLKSGRFTMQGSIQDRKNQYIKASNPLSLYIQECCVVSDKLFVKYHELYNDYLRYLREHKNRRVNYREFRAALEDEGLYVEHTSKKLNDEFVNTNWISGIDLRRNCDNCADCSKIPTPPPTIVRNEVGKTLQLAQKQQFLSLLESNTELDEEFLTKQFGDALISHLKADGTIFCPKPGRVRLL